MFGWSSFAEDVRLAEEPRHVSLCGDDRRHDRLQSNRRPIGLAESEADDSHSPAAELPDDLVPGERLGRLRICCGRSGREAPATEFRRPAETVQPPQRPDCRRSDSQKKAGRGWVGMTLFAPAPVTGVAKQGATHRLSGDRRQRAPSRVGKHWAAPSRQGSSQRPPGCRHG